MQFPYMVIFTETDAAHRYLVKANDIRQAERRARRKYLDDPASGNSGSLSRVMNLTPLQQNGLFLPRIDGTLVSSEPCDTKEAAVEAALEFLKRRGART
jgi:hypothetical protein